MLDNQESEFYSAQDHLSLNALSVCKPSAVSKNCDEAIFSISTQITDNYMKIIKAHVIPNLSMKNNLKIREIRVLGCIHRNHQRILASDVAKYLREDPATVSRAVKKLMRFDMLKRHESALDARVQFLVLTETGAALAQEYNDKVQDVCRNLSDVVRSPISHEDIQQFIRLGKRIREYSKELCEVNPRHTVNLLNVSKG